MREIKFRAWDGENIRMDVTGFEHGVKNEMAGVFIDGDYFIISDDVKELPSDINPRASVMQFTGLQDVNGVDIYEGDIVSLWYAPQTTAMGKIKFENGGFYFKTTQAKPEICLAYDCIYEHGNSFTIKGNIHENKELL